MSSLHRRLLACFRALVWALCLAVPLQAAAVAARSSLLLPSAAAPAGDERQHAHHGANADAAPGLSATDCHAEDGGADAHAQAQPHAQHKCSSSCAACCIASALPSAAAPLLQPRGGDVLASTPCWATLSCSSARLERPPRA